MTASTQTDLDLTQLTTIARQLIVLEKHYAEAVRPVDRKTTQAAYYGAAGLAGALLGVTYSGPVQALRAALLDAGDRPTVSPTSGTAERAIYVAWVLRAITSLTARLGYLQDGDFAAATN